MPDKFEQAKSGKRGLRRWIAPGMAVTASAGILAVSLLGWGTTGSFPVNAGPAMAQEALSRAPLSFADLAEKVTPAVVSIDVRNGTRVGQDSEDEGPRDNDRGRDRFFNFPDLPEDHPLYKFFKRFGEQFPQMPPRRFSRAAGSGFFISADGYIVTNNHVVAEASEIRVTVGEDQKTYTAKLVGTDPRTDIALLKVDADRDFHYLEFADKPARVGDWVLAVGNPFGLGGTVTAGIVSARGRDIGSSPYDFLQIDAAVNKGNSGGPAINLEGKVVGVNTAIFSPSGGNVGIAFAIPAKLVKEIVAELKEHGTVRRGWLGVTIQDVNEDLAAGLGMNPEDPYGALVTKILEDGPAAKSDLKVGDAIIRVRGERVEDSRDLARKIAAIPPGTETELTIFRDGGEKTVTVKLGTFPSSDKLAALQSPRSSGREIEDLGLSLAPASEYGQGASEGVAIVSVKPGSVADDKGLRSGDIIVEVAGRPVSSPTDVANGVSDVRRKGRKAVIFQVRRGDQQRFVALPLNGDD